MLARQLIDPKTEQLGYRSKIIKRSVGVALVEGPVPAQMLEKYQLHQDLTSFRQPTKQHSALVDIASLPQGRIYLARVGDLVIGYVTFHPPDEFERWGKGRMEGLIELGGIETIPQWRGQGLSTALLDMAFKDEWVEDNVVFATEYYWHWDLKGTNLSVWQYRDMMERLFGKVGLKPCITDEPDICCHSANVLMVRKGKRVSNRKHQQFEALCIQGVDLEWLV